MPHASRLQVTWSVKNIKKGTLQKFICFPNGLAQESLVSYGNLCTLTLYPCRVTEDEKAKVISFKSLARY